MMNSNSVKNVTKHTIVDLGCCHAQNLRFEVQTKENGTALPRRESIRGFLRMLVCATLERESAVIRLTF